MDSKVSSIADSGKVEDIKDVHRRLTYNTSTRGQTMTYKTLNRKLKIE